MIHGFFFKTQESGVFNIVAACTNVKTKIKQFFKTVGRIKNLGVAGRLETDQRTP